MRATRRTFCALSVVVLVLLAAYRFRTRAVPTENATNTTRSFSLEELCRESFHNGWRIKHPPDLPGPYRRRLDGFLYYHADDLSSSVRLRERSGAVVWEEKTRPGVEFMTLILETTGGQRAHGLLVRGE